MSAAADATLPRPVQVASHELRICLADLPCQEGWVICQGLTCWYNLTWLATLAQSAEQPLRKW